MTEPLLPLWPAPEPIQAPYQGRTPQTRAASRSGAVYATQDRGEKVAALLELFRTHGPLTINEAAALTGWLVSSICSLRTCIADRLEEVEPEIVQWADGRTTTRTRWRLK